MGKHYFIAKLRLAKSYFAKLSLANLSEQSKSKLGIHKCTAHAYQEGRFMFLFSPQRGIRDDRGKKIGVWDAPLRLFLLLLPEFPLILLALDSALHLLILKLQTKHRNSKKISRFKIIYVKGPPNSFTSMMMTRSEKDRGRGIV
jgi:hypothetical protein